MCCGGFFYTLRKVVRHNAKPFKLNVAAGLAAHNSEHYQNSSSKHHALREYSGTPKSAEVQLSISQFWKLDITKQ